MTAFLAALKPRLFGALAAGASTYLVAHDWKAAAATATTFVIYGGVHAATGSAEASSGS